MVKRKSIPKDSWQVASRGHLLLYATLSLKYISKAQGTM
jgi:hypothetical protein